MPLKELIWNTYGFNREVIKALTNEEEMRLAELDFLRKQIKFLDNIKRIQDLWIILRYVMIYKDIMKYQRGIPLTKMDEVNTYFGNKNVTKTFKTLLANSAYSFTVKLPWSFSLDSIILKLMMELENVPITNPEFDSSVIDTYEKMTVADISDRLNKLIDEAPRPTKPFFVFRYNYDPDLPLPILDKEIGERFEIDTFLSTSMNWDKSFLNNFIDFSKVCAKSCCIYTIEVPAKYPCLFINAPGYEMLLPQGTIYEITDMYSTTKILPIDSEFDATMFGVNTRPSGDREEWFKRVCESEIEIIVIHLKIIVLDSKIDSEKQLVLYTRQPKESKKEFASRIVQDIGQNEKLLDKIKRKLGIKNMPREQILQYLLVAVNLMVLTYSMKVNIQNLIKFMKKVM